MGYLNLGHFGQHGKYLLSSCVAKCLRIEDLCKIQAFARMLIANGKIGDFVSCLSDYFLIGLQYFLDYLLSLLFYSFDHFIDLNHLMNLICSV